MGTIIRQLTISCSWDVPIPPEAQDSAHQVKTTGFSGTNDIKSLLPLNIAQHDLPTLQHTNAEVLGYLLQDRNRRYLLAIDRGRRLTEDGLLKSLFGTSIRILIDAGAYILSMSNRTLVLKWLQYDHNARAAVYFTGGRTVVIYKDGKEQLLLTSPWKDGITDELLVFFDEANCRGIDLKLPTNGRAALTLALNQTKDHTVQGKYPFVVLRIFVPSIC